MNSKVDLISADIEPGTQAKPRTVALVGNPNVGKTSVFNRLTSLLAKTANFSGTTIERRVGMVNCAEASWIQIVDLPGLFSLDPQSPEEKTTRSFLDGEANDPPDGLLVVVDGTNLERSLFVVGQALELRRPTLVVINMIDLSRAQGLQIDLAKLEVRLGCRVLAVSARTGEGFEQLKGSLQSFFVTPSLDILAEPPCESCGTCPYAHGHRWAATLARESTRSGPIASSVFTDRADRILTHSLVGPCAFALTMLGVFALVFWLAQFPMDVFEGLFGQMGSAVASWLPVGDFSSLITDGIIGGVGGVMVFLPQICILFFALTVLEDSGYLSRAVVVVDRWMRRAGLPGQAFVPLLAAHACAIPAIMATRVIESRRDRLASILVIPLMTCSARLPVYTMIAAMLFPENALYAALLFAGAYGLGMVTAFVVAWVFKITILPGNPAPLILDLPPYRIPSLKNAARQAYERGWVFLRDAGTTILVISIAIWALSTYPKLSDEQFESRIMASAIDLALLEAGEQANVRARLAQEHSLVGRAGTIVEPIFRPLGFDWKTSVGVLTSFAAREVVVSTMSVLYGLGEEPEDEFSLQSKLSSAIREDGSPVFNTATCVSLLIFFVLAMQCLPTQAVTRKETGTWWWAVFQFVYMSGLAYVIAFVAHQVVQFAGL